MNTEVKLEYHVAAEALLIDDLSTCTVKSDDVTKYILRIYIF